MKLALIGTSLYGQGAEFVLATVAKGLSDRGHEVDVIVSGVHSETGKLHSDWKAFDIGPRVKLIEMRAKRGRYCVFELRRLLKGVQYDVVMCHAAPYAIPLVLSSAFLRHRTKLVYVEHLGGIGVDKYGNKTATKQSLVSILKNAMMSRYDAQFAVSKGTLDAIHRVTGYPLSKLHLVYNPAIRSDFSEKKKLPPQHPWLINRDIPVVVAAGALCEVKHFDLLIEAFAMVRKHMPARLIIFGEGPLRATYEALARSLGVIEDLSLPGFSNQLPAEIQNASCFVVSSYVESFSIVLVEAMACGVPVVSVDAPYGPREVLNGGEYGILVHNNDPVALAKGIEQVLSGRGVRANENVLSKYSVESIAADYESTLVSLFE